MFHEKEYNNIISDVGQLSSRGANHVSVRNVQV